MKLTRIIPLILALACSRAPGADLRTYETRYYTLYTDVHPDAARETVVRMTRMAEEYAYRTREFSGVLRKRLPFYLYKNPDDFYATGAPRAAAGYFNGRELVAIGGSMDARTWHIIQHEGFHQFARQAIGGQPPPWVNEGLAEYFGEAVFTGDGFVSGVIPQWRLKRIQSSLSAGKFRSLEGMMNLTAEQWNADLDVTNYDQAWSMVHFLAHGEQGRYQRAFGAFMTQVGNRTPWRDAWARTFRDTRGFEQRWRAYWTGLGDDPTGDLYTQANVAALTSFVARAVSQKQSFDSFEAFTEMATKGQLKAHPDDWLPPKLLEQNLQIAAALAKQKCVYAIQAASDPKLPTLVCTLPDGRRVEARFTLRNDRVATVMAELSRP